MKKLTLLVGIAIGYVLGSKAGRERYEEIKSGAHKVAENPKVKAAASRAQETVGDVASSAANTVRHQASVQPGP